MAEGNRILFAIPWGRRVILGTTDTDYDGPLDDVNAQPAEVAYVLGVANRAFPSAELGPADVMSTWAGLRPLVAAKRGGPSDISRAHQITMPEPGWFDVVGGKLTTYRLIGEQVVDRIVSRAGRSGPRSRTAEEPLLGLTAQQPHAESGVLPPEFTRELVDHYCRNEWAVFPDDIMLRRTSWRHYAADADQIAIQVEEWMRTTGTNDVK
jgi:glycerol-3-phosphate dehydrogenase